MTAPPLFKRGLHRTGEKGSVALEWVIIAPGVLLVMAVLALAGRVILASGAVEQAAADAARAASLARHPAAAVSEAQSAAAMSLQGQGLECLSTSVDVDTSGFAVPAGQHATVSVTITCPIKVSDLPIPGLSSRTAVKTGVSPIDTYRQR
ncbi:TadE/TadG family type IV pilus assembly protein [Phytoactinopolyspora mesophila]|uniref:Pilus assembly protein n=1 Tax=Phytoactinopolyspora mesophila TaxID=2650750 RepID=A0A7K3MA63_9ACTN|nr:TadE/TadG family type IV pilus assembly protein [Phytoactinopolyspora mesophila]NDL60205.1 pilus assembly protein [Phytoactinopolyspora mesophila]